MNSPNRHVEGEFFSRQLLVILVMFDDIVDVNIVEVVVMSTVLVLTNGADELVAGIAEVRLSMVNFSETEGSDYNLERYFFIRNDLSRLYSRFNNNNTCIDFFSLSLSTHFMIY